MPESRNIPSWGRRTSVLVAVSVIVSALVQIPAAFGIAFWIMRGQGWPAAIYIALAIAGPLTLLIGRKYPGPTVAVLSAFALLDVLVGPSVGPPYIALGFAIVAAIVRGFASWAAVSVAVAWAGTILLATLAGKFWHPAQIVFATLGLAFCFGIGWLWRVRRNKFAAAHEDALRRRQSAEQLERVRIARELHDVLGHALSQINVQASVGLHLFDGDPEQGRTALANVKETSKTALEEVRSVLGVLREGEVPLVPQAELAELPRLLRGMSTPTFTIDLRNRLDQRAPSRATQFAAYRIVQEAVTNIVRHAEARHAVVKLSRSGQALLLTIEDDGQGFPTSDEFIENDVTKNDATIQSTHGGMLGMRERAALLGGHVEFGSSTELGGARVSVSLPWGSAA